MQLSFLPKAPSTKRHVGWLNGPQGSAPKLSSFHDHGLIFQANSSHAKLLHNHWNAKNSSHPKPQLQLLRPREQTYVDYVRLFILCQVASARVLAPSAALFGGRCAPSPQASRGTFCGTRKPKQFPSRLVTLLQPSSSTAQLSSQDRLLRPNVTGTCHVLFCAFTPSLWM